MNEAVLAGFSDEQAEWARASFEDVIAPAWDESADALVESLASLDLDQRWAGVVTAHYLGLLAPVRAEAYGLDDSGETRGVEAGVLLMALDALAAEMQEAAPEVFDLLAPDLADAAERCRRYLPGGPFAAAVPPAS